MIMTESVQLAFCIFAAVFTPIGVLATFYRIIEYFSDRDAHRFIEADRIMKVRKDLDKATFDCLNLYEGNLSRGAAIDTLKDKVESHRRDAEKWALAISGKQMESQVQLDLMVKKVDDALAPKKKKKK